MLPFLVAAAVALAPGGDPQPAISSPPDRAGPVPAASVQQQELYRTVTLRAAPGHLLELMDLLREERAFHESIGESPSLWMRHSQGDHWDLLVMYPMGEGMGGYFERERVRRRDEGRTPEGRSGAELREAMDEATAWRSEIFARGAPETIVRDRWEDAGLFHVEMFLALAGKRDELIREREMENEYLERTGREPNLIFVREAGAATDSFTIGFYRDLPHFAAGGGATPEEQEEAALAAGFEGADFIGTYLRELIAEHHDTLATAIR